MGSAIALTQFVKAPHKFALGSLLPDLKDLNSGPLTMPPLDGGTRNLEYVLSSWTTGQIQNMKLNTKLGQCTISHHNPNKVWTIVTPFQGHLVLDEAVEQHLVKIMCCLGLMVR